MAVADEAEQPDPLGWVAFDGLAAWERELVVENLQKLEELVGMAGEG